MKKFTIAIALFLSFAMILPCFTSCDLGGKNNETTAPVTAATPVSDPAATTAEPDETTVADITTAVDITTVDVTTNPEAMTAPEVTTAPDVTTAPEATTAPDVTTAPEIITTPEVTTAPEVTTQEIPVVTEPAHTHSFSATWKSDASSHWKECSCGEKSELAGHTYGDWTVTKGATETSTGERYHICTVCGFKETNTIPTLDHVHVFGTEWKSDGTNHWHECACGERGDSATHIYDNWTVTKEATCTAEGEKKRICSACGYEEIVKTEKLEHVVVIDAAIQATCTEDGKTEGRHCSVCNTVLAAQQIVPATGHSFGVWTITTMPGVHQEGVMSRTCSKCNFVENNPMPGTHDFSAEWKTDDSYHWHECSCGEKTSYAEHQFGSWTTIQESTVSSEGARIRNCGICGYEDRQVIPKIGDEVSIKSVADFLNMNPLGYYRLDSDLVISESYTEVFEGYFNGNGHTVTVNGVPMFADIGKAVVKNLTIAGTIASDTNVGALAASCSANIFTKFSDYAIIEKCTNKANVTMTVPDTAPRDSYWGVGGFIGKSAADSGAMFIDCINEGTITVKCIKNEPCRFYAGGFAGICDTFLARNSENRGDIKFDGDYANCLGYDGCAGFVGRVAMTSNFNYCNIEYCVNNGNIKGGRYAGGFLAYSGLSGNTCQYLMDNTPYRFFANINNGNIEAKEWAGGIAGYCYCNGTNDAQTFDVEFNLVNGKIISDKWCSPFVAYSNSTKNILMYNISTAELAPRTDGAAEFMFVFLGCSTANYRDNTTVQHNYIVDDAGAVKWLTYGESESYSGNRIPISWGIEKNYVTIVTISQLATGEIAYKINQAANANGFNQTIGKDLTPTPSRESSYVTLVSGYYLNISTPVFPILEYYDIK